MTMDDNNGLSSSFVERQRKRLEARREQLLRDSREAKAEDRTLSRRQGAEVQDSGDEGALEAQRDVADVLGAEDELRLNEIDRALEKIAQGSYGLSDDSGERIALERLEAIPEARYTFEEEAQREQ